MNYVQLMDKDTLKLIRSFLKGFLSTKKVYVHLIHYYPGPFIIQICTFDICLHDTFAASTLMPLRNDGCSSCHYFFFLPCPKKRLQLKVMDYDESQNVNIDFFLREQQPSKKKLNYYKRKRHTQKAA